MQHNHVAECWVAHASRVLVFTSRENRLFPIAHLEGKFATVRHRRSEPDWRSHASRVRYPTVFAWARLLYEFPI